MGAGARNRSVYKRSPRRCCERLPEQGRIGQRKIRWRSKQSRPSVIRATCIIVVSCRAKEEWYFRFMRREKIPKRKQNASCTTGQGERPMEHQSAPQLFSGACTFQIISECSGRYSMRSACMGDIDAARLAGMMAAKNEQIASAPAAMPSASGSQDETP
jgi:hypothetical protein